MEFKSPQVHFVGKIKKADNFCEGVIYHLVRVAQFTLKHNLSMDKIGNIFLVKPNLKVFKFKP